jgi:hypothetical protein
MCQGAPGYTTRLASVHLKVKEIVAFIRALRRVARPLQHEDTKSKRFFLCESRKLGRETNKRKTPWSESASELYRPSDRCLSAK